VRFRSGFGGFGAGVTVPAGEGRGSCGLFHVEH